MKRQKDIDFLRFKAKLWTIFDFEVTSYSCYVKKLNLFATYMQAKAESTEFCRDKRDSVLWKEVYFAKVTRSE